ncbi:MAG TPA: SRPBCC family protein [Candidatus Bathyarchaeia archaeon]|nr:SRPBCC family protein [Candidatus Bathyarchaeia archaeon]
MRVALWIGFSVAVLIAAVVLIGWLLPRDHVATRMGRYRQKPEAIWEAITNVEAMPGWREGLKSVQKLPERNGLPAHVEVTTSGTIPMETVETESPRKLVSRIAGEKLPFGGTWTFEIAPTEEGATLRITERGWISNPFFRFMSRFVFGQTSQMEAYLRSLAKKFGEPARIEE